MPGPGGTGQVGLAPGQAFQVELADCTAVVIVARIDDDTPAGSIVSVSIADITPPALHGYLNRLLHLPFEREAFELSALEAIGARPLPQGFADAYAQWRAPFDKGEAGIFTLPVEEVLPVLFEALAQRGEN